jgi:hypothetical protein
LAASGSSGSGVPAAARDTTGGWAADFSATPAIASAFGTAPWNSAAAHHVAAPSHHVAAAQLPFGFGGEPSVPWGAAVSAGVVAGAGGLAAAAPASFAMFHAGTATSGVTSSGAVGGAGGVKKLGAVVTGGAASAASRKSPHRPCMCSITLI